MLRIFHVWMETAPIPRGVSVLQEPMVPRACLWAWNPEPGDVERGQLYAKESGYTMFLIDAPEDQSYQSVKAEALDYARNGGVNV